MQKRGKWRSILAAVAVAVGLAVPTAPAAVAADRPVDVTKFSVSDIVFGRGECKKTTVKVSKSVDSSVMFLSLDTDVTSGGYVKGYLFFDGDTSSQRFQVCPFQGLGAYKIGPTEVSGLTEDYESFDYLDNTSKTFYVRGQAKAYLKAARSGSKVTLTASAKYFNPDSYGYSKYSPKKAKFQVKSGSTWKTIKTLDFKSGKASYTLRKSSKASYRVTFDKTSRVTAATSASVWK